MIDWISFFNPEFLARGFANFFAFGLLALLTPLAGVFSLGFLILILVVIFRKKIRQVWVKRIGIGAGILLMLIEVGFWPVVNYLGPYHVYKDTQKYIDAHHEGLVTLFTEQFDEFESCQNMTPKQPCEYYANQAILDAISRDTSLRNFSSTYFIRLSSDEELQILFISGTFSSVPSSTIPLEKVAKFLKNDSSFFLYAFIDESYMPHYIDAVHGEGEILVPVQVDGKTVGALVRVYAS